MEFSSEAENLLMEFISMDFVSISELQRRKQKAQEENNDQLLAEMCNKLGNYLVSEQKFDDALKEFQEESLVWSQLNRQMDFGRAARMIGEVYLRMERYKDALRHENIYLKQAKLANDFVELQRAHATIGRCYLLMAEDEAARDPKDAEVNFKAAEKSFLKSLMICRE
jgi:tetratricopeptide (TPR) repeat protein